MTDESKEVCKDRVGDHRCNRPDGHTGWHTDGDKVWFANPPLKAKVSRVDLHDLKSEIHYLDENELKSDLISLKMEVISRAIDRANYARSARKKGPVNVGPAVALANRIRVKFMLEA
jgi:hypothetical protein